MFEIVIRRSCARLLACAFIVSPTWGWAQPSAPSRPSESNAQDTRPWAAGVSEDEKATASDLHVAGNYEFAESRFAQAFAKYNEAIRHWDHPVIRYNMAVSLIHLDRPVEALDNLVRSLAHGAAALDAEAYIQALTYQKLLHAQLGHVKIVCQEPGAEVTLDGKFLFIGPGAADLFLPPGKHQVVATKPRFSTSSRALDLVAGQLTAVDIAPTVEAKPITRTVRRWDAWKPWAVLASGAGVAALGTVSYVLASKHFAAYDREVERRCPSGCTAETLAGFPTFGDQRRRAEKEQVIALTLFSVGGAVVISGLVGLALNQPSTRVESNRSLLVTPISGGLQFVASWTL